MVALGGCGGGLSEDVGGPPGAPALVVQDDAELLYRSTSRLSASLDLLEAIGVKTVRITAGWRRTAPEPESERRPDFDAADPGDYADGAWDRLDRAVDLARERGLRVMLDVAFGAPAWARAGPDARSAPNPKELALFARAVVRRYRDRVGTYTIWNEPNHPGFLAPQWDGVGQEVRPRSPHLYREMVLAAYPAMKDEQGNARILIGGLASHGRSRGVAPLHFLREMACVDAALRPLRVPECRGFRGVPGDGLAHHPYSTRTTPNGVEPRASRDDVPMARLGRLSALLEALAAADRIDPDVRDLYLTEYGYETRPPDPGSPFTPERAARMSAWAEAMAARNARVRTVAQFLVRDLPGTGGGQLVGVLPDWQSGLLFADGRPKPLATAIAAPLHVEAAPDGRALLWARVRSGAGRRLLRIEALAGGSWQTVLEGMTDERGVLGATQPVPDGNAFRLATRRGGRWVPGPAVDVLGP